MAWAVLGSVWIHLGLLLLFLVRCGTPDEALPRRERALALVARVRARPSTRAATDVTPANSGARTGNGITPPTDGLSPPETEAVALDLADPDLWKDLDRWESLTDAQLRALDPALLRSLADAPAGLRERLRRLAERAPEVTGGGDPGAGAGESAEVASLRATANPSDHLAAERPREDGVSELQTATSALTDPVGEKSEPEDEGEVAWLEYVRTPEAAPNRRPVDGTRLISERDTRTEHASRTWVVAPNEGPVSRSVLGLPSSPGTPAPAAVDGLPDGESGDAPAAGIPTARPRAQSAGQGARGRAQGVGAPDTGGGRRGGDLAAGGRTAPNRQGGVWVTPGAAARSGPAPAPDGDLPDPRRWAPKVARIVRPQPTTTPAPVALIAPDPAPGRANAASPRPDDQKDRGGTERTIPEDQDASPTLAESPTPEEGEDTETVKVVEKVESIADLRADLGWGGFERTQDQPRRIVPGTRQSEGSMPTSPQSAAEALTVSLVASTDAVDSPLGRYRAALDREISKLWLTMDLSVHERALGIQGDVFVRFLVESDGKVSGKVLTRSSGYASLDSMALDAIPERLPRIPRDVDYQRIYHEYRFHYRNPTIVGGSGGSP